MATAETTNIKRNEIIISANKDWELDPTGRVPKYASGVMSSSRAREPLARIDPKIWAPTYKGAYII